MFFRKQWRAFLWALFILVITGLPGSYIPDVVSFWEWLQPDKIVHVGVFAVLSFAILYGARVQYLQSSQRYFYVIAAVGLATFYGLLTEVLQYYVFVGRSGNVYDALADGLGALTGWMLFVWINWKKINTINNLTAN